jgi:hypothetical protein
MKNILTRRRNQMTEYHCTYKKVFPVDEYGRLGGLYSLADVPIMEYKELTRPGVIESMNEEEQFYLVRDTEKNFTEWVPMADVTVVQ